MWNAGLFDQEYRLLLTAVECRLLARPISPGQWGGNQRTADLVQQRCYGGSGCLTETELSDVYRKAWAYGNGTYQKNYFRPVLQAARRAGWRPSAELMTEVRERRAEVFGRGHQRHWS